MIKQTRAIAAAAALFACLGSNAVFGQTNDATNSIVKPALAAADAPAAAPAMKWPPDKEGEVKGSKVLVVLVYDQSCYYACKKVRPLIKELVPTYGGRIAYVEFNSAPDALNASQKIAKDLHLTAFLTDSTNNVPLVGLFNKRHKLLKEIPGAVDKDSYKAAIDKALSDN